MCQCPPLVNQPDLRKTLTLDLDLYLFFNIKQFYSLQVPDVYHIPKNYKKKKSVLINHSQ